MSNTVVLFRRELSTENEFLAATKYFDVYEQRCALPHNSLVIGRYSVLPYYKELENDLSLQNSKLINTFKQHEFIADIRNWSTVLKDYTPKTWYTVEDIPYNDNGPFVVKGLTNSRKHNWNTKMYSPNKTELGTIISNLFDDSLINQQGICIRKYEKLQEITTGINDLPITIELRVFVYNDTIIADSFYWSSYINETMNKLGFLPNLTHFSECGETAPFILLNNVIKTLSKEKDCPSFYVIDIAKKEDGEWMVIELNDGQMSGLSCIDEDVFYNNLKRKISIKY